MQNKQLQKKRNKNTIAYRFFAPAGIFSAMFFYLECLLRATNTSASFFGIGLFRCLLSSIAAGMFLWLLSSLIPNKIISMLVSSAIISVIAFFVGAEALVKDYFGTYYSISYMLGMRSQVAGEFGSEMNRVIVSHIWMIPLAALPSILTLVFRKRIFPKTRKFRRIRLWAFQLAAFVVFFAFNVTVCLAGDSGYYSTNYTANNAIPLCGIINTLRLEIKYSIFKSSGDYLGSDEILTLGENADMSGQSASDESTSANDSATTSVSISDEEEIKEEASVEYDDNVLNIDFDALIASDTDETLLALDQYFSSQTPTKKNEYTGIFEGKNLIMITAEAFSYTVIDKERTPALYELANNGFVMTNYYQPDWTQSTTGGEFAHMTGIIPTWVDGHTAFTTSTSDAMPFALGWIFKAEGYTSRAYHNNTYSYYGRDLTHPNLGYDYIGIGNGLELSSFDAGWPASDLEMLQATIPAEIDQYVSTGQPFHTYYMSVSGHADYGWDVNSMSEKNRAVIESYNLGYSEYTLAYLAAQQELEYALEYLLAALDEAQIADDTVIVLTPDHYPYALTSDVDYYQELVGYDTNAGLTAYYKNTLILWSGCVDEPVEVEVPSTAVDAVPTLLNLFGIDYDSRLLSGRDLLAPDVEVGAVDSNMHVALFANYSWITNAGTYEANTEVFTPAQGVELEDEAAYVNAVSSIVANRYSYAKYILQMDYYRHVFPNWTGGMKLTDALAFTDS